MSERVVYGQHPLHRELNVVLQFLKDQGLDSAFHTLQEEAHHTYQPERLDADNVLLHALALYSENHADVSDDSRIAVSELLDRKRSANVVSSMVTELPEAHSSNIIACRFVDVQDGRVVSISASVDKTFKLCDMINKEVVVSKTVDISAAILCFDRHPIQKNLLVAGGMDGAVYVVDALKLLRGENCIQQKFHDHDHKYCLQVKWSQDGLKFATSSRDNTVIIYAYDAESKEYSLKKKIPCRDVPEAIEWIPNALVFAVRGDNFLRFINYETLDLDQDRLNMNMLNDNHVSFTPLCMKYNSTLDLIAVATDTSRVFVVRRGIDGPLRTYYGTINNEYSTPRIAFNRDGSIIYVTSQDNTIYAWDVATEVLLDKLTGHHKLVRDLDFHFHEDILLSCSYDRSVRFWS